MEDKDFYLMVERHEEKIKTLERDVTALREVQSEIRAMNETLVTLATELKNPPLKHYALKGDNYSNQSIEPTM